MRKIIMLSLLLLIALPALAQDAVPDPDAEPAFLTLNLEAGFTLDPFVVSVVGGGSIDASDLSEGCLGFINSNPTVKVNYTGDADFLRAFFYSSHDSVLVVHTPDDEYLCNDDANDLLLDASLDLENPPQGEYVIWVGAFWQDQQVPGFLVFTANPDMRTGMFDPGALVNREAMPDDVARIAALPRSSLGSESRLKSMTLKAEDETLTQELTVTGDIPLFDVDLGDNMTCGGFVSNSPSLVFDWSGEVDTLRLFFESDSDSTLLVLGPEDSVYCGDDSANSENLNPVVDIANPAEGVYQVYVGDFDPDTDLTGMLTITQDIELEPQTLASNHEE
ncbi:MAG: hypothetical protein K8L99_01870 [Anaerolineae bacterium]|nr:hypothetical protein [Anaerolineae bacterium]